MFPTSSQKWSAAMHERLPTEGIEGLPSIPSAAKHQLMCRPPYQREYKVPSIPSDPIALQISIVFIDHASRE